MPTAGVVRVTSAATCTKQKQESFKTIQKQTFNILQHLFECSVAGICRDKRLFPDYFFLDYEANDDRLIVSKFDLEMLLSRNDDHDHDTTPPCYSRSTRRSKDHHSGDDHGDDHETNDGSSKTGGLARRSLNRDNDEEDVAPVVMNSSMDVLSNTIRKRRRRRNSNREEDSSKPFLDEEDSTSIEGRRNHVDSSKFIDKKSNKSWTNESYEWHSSKSQHSPTASNDRHNCRNSRSLSSSCSSSSTTSSSTGSYIDDSKNDFEIEMRTQNSGGLPSSISPLTCSMIPLAPFEYEDEHDREREDDEFKINDVDDDDDCTRPRATSSKGSNGSNRSRSNGTSSSSTSTSNDSSSQRTEEKISWTTSSNHSTRNSKNRKRRSARSNQDSGGSMQEMTNHRLVERFGQCDDDHEHFRTEALLLLHWIRHGVVEMMKRGQLARFLFAICSPSYSNEQHPEEKDRIVESYVVS